MSRYAAPAPVSPTKPPAAASQAPAADGKAVTRRLQSELMSLMMANTPGISAFPDNDNLFKWAGTITGAAETVYEGLVFRLVLRFPPNYPFAAPTVTFDNPCFHPNVDDNGNICLDILKDQWSAVYSVQTILLSIQALLNKPNNDSPLNGTAAQLWDNPTEFKRMLLAKYRPPTN